LTGKIQNDNVEEGGGDGDEVKVSRGDGDEVRALFP